MICPLSDISLVRTGYPFRGKVTDKPDGYAHVVQMKDVGPTLGISWGNVITTDLPGRQASGWVEDGDIIFTARGKTNYAIVAEGVPGVTVLSPHLFQVKIKAGLSVLPEFVAWQINQAPAQKYLKRSAEGSLMIGIRRAVLEALPLFVPPMQEQKKIMRLVSAWRDEMQSIQALTANHQKLMEAIAGKVLNRPLELGSNENEFTN